ncbi:spondin domain-containing protein [Botrimarina sp.]|uniref:spondin domain-containing protein n=1 Tax=Botrimarina sp. TaxID=2795802 RepID=UPI0032EEB931
MRFSAKSLLGATALTAAFWATDDAAAVQVRITVENLAPAGSVAIAPLRFGFGDGTFDAFDVGSPAPLLGAASIADAPIVSIAEGGSGATWFPAFEAAEPDADLGSVLGPEIPPFRPGDVASAVFEIDPANRYFTFATMVVPSNDHFLGNDSPFAFEVFDADGNLILNEIVEDASRIWDAGSETENPLNAAFLVVGNNAQREDENDPVTFNFADLAAFDGLETAAGYTFDAGLLSADTPVIRIGFEIVPEPTGVALLVSAMSLVAASRRRRA